MPELNCYLLSELLILLDCHCVHVSSNWPCCYTVLQDTSQLQTILMPHNMSELHTSINPTSVSCSSAIQHQNYALKYNSLEVKFILGPYFLFEITFLSNVLYRSEKRPLTLRQKHTSIWSTEETIHISQKLCYAWTYNPVRVVKWSVWWEKSLCRPKFFKFKVELYEHFKSSFPYIRQLGFTWAFFLEVWEEMTKVGFLWP